MLGVHRYPAVRGGGSQKQKFNLPHRTSYSRTRLLRELIVGHFLSLVDINDYLLAKISRKNIAFKPMESDGLNKTGAIIATVIVVVAVLSRAITVKAGLSIYEQLHC